MRLQVKTDRLKGLPHLGKINLYMRKFPMTAQGHDDPFSLLSITHFVRNLALGTLIEVESLT